MSIVSLRRSLIVVPLVVSALLSSSLAQAAVVSYFLDKSNDLDDGVNYVKVTIADSTDVVGDIDFTVEVIESAFPSPFSNFGMQEFLFNFDNSLAVTAANMVDVDPTSWMIKENQNAGGGFGKFEFEWMGSGSTRTSYLSFSITGVSGDTVDSYAIGADWLNNGSDEFFAAHIAGYSDSLTGNTSGKFAGSSVVPLPGAVWLFGTAMLAFVGIRARS